MTKENPRSGPATLVWNIEFSTGAVVLGLAFGAELGAAVGSNDMHSLCKEILAWITRLCPGFLKNEMKV